MRIVHLTSNDAATGGGKAVATLVRAQREAGHEVLAVVGVPGVADATRVAMPETAASRLVDGAAGRLGRVAGMRDLVRPGFRATVAMLNRLRPDVIHLHWCYGRRSIPVSTLRTLTKRHPVVWTFHDMWALTGGCTNSRGCEHWRSGCGDCPVAGVDEMVSGCGPGFGDMTATVWRVKRRAYRASRFVVLAPSRWMGDLAAASPLLAGKQVVVVPNGVDTAVFAPAEDRAANRATMGIGARDFVIAYVGKPDAIDAYRGRLEVFESALQRLVRDVPGIAADARLLLVGRGGGEVARRSGLRACVVGPVREDGDMAHALRTADVFVTTTQYDNCPQVVQEAMACGVPVVGSRVGGVPELIRHGETGLLCGAGAPDEFAAAIGDLYQDHRLRVTMGERARSVAERDYAVATVGDRVTDVYADACARFTDAGRGDE